MERIIRFNESITIFDERIKDFFPKEIEIYTNSGTFKLKLGDCTRETSIIRCVWNFQSHKITGDVLSDGEPDFLCMDLHFLKKEKDFKLLVDITYGDVTEFEFSIEKGKSSVIHYNGQDSMSNETNKFGFGDKTISEFVKLFNQFGFDISDKDLTFIDKYPNSYKPHTESLKLMPLSQDEIILLLDNTKPPKNLYIKPILEYLQTRGINFVKVSSIGDIKELSDKKIIGCLSSGSDYRITDGCDDLNKWVIENIEAPYLGMCFAFQSLCKSLGCKIKTGDFIHDNLKLSWYKENPLFVGIDMNMNQFSFSFHDYVISCPKGWTTIAKLDNKVCGIWNKNQNKFGLLFHPEDCERTWVVLDNFIEICKPIQKELELLKKGQFES